MAMSENIGVNKRFAVESPDFKDYIANIRNRMDRINLSETQRAEANSDLTMIEAQILSGDPNSRAVRACMISLSKVLEGISNDPYATATLSLVSLWLWKN